MAELKIIEQKPLNMAELKEEIKDIKKRDEELSFRTAKVSEQLDLLKIVKPKDAQEIYEKIEQLEIPRFKDVHIHKIIDLMPCNAVELKNIIQGYSLTVSADNVEKILAILGEFTSKKK